MQMLPGPPGQYFRGEHMYGAQVDVGKNSPLSEKLPNSKNNFTVQSRKGPRSFSKFLFLPFLAVLGIEPKKC